MRYIQGQDRRQAHLLPPSIEKDVGAEAPVRVIDAFVDQLDLAARSIATCTPRLPPAAKPQSRSPIRTAAASRKSASATTHPEMAARRRETFEHLFGTLRQWGHDEFLCRGLKIVRAEFILSALVYHLRQPLNVSGVARLLAALRPA